MTFNHQHQPTLNCFTLDSEGNKTYHAYLNIFDAWRGMSGGNAAGGHAPGRETVDDTLHVTRKVSRCSLARSPTTPRQLQHPHSGKAKVMIFFLDLYCTFIRVQLKCVDIICLSRRLHQHRHDNNPIWQSDDVRVLISWNALLVNPWLDLIAGSSERRQPFTVHDNNDLIWWYVVGAQLDLYPFTILRVHLFVAMGMQACIVWIWAIL